MKFPAEIDNLKTLKKGMKVVIAIENKDVKEVMRNIHNFIDKPLKVTLDIDADEQLERMSLITGEQRKKIYALLKDIDSQTGQGVESVKMTLKKGLVMDSNYQTAELFSLSDCSKETAGEFIEFLVVFAFRHGVELKEYPRNIFNDIERYIKVCWKEKICVICGKPADKAHYDAIGMGNNRDKLDDSEHRAYSLCREHHTEEHNIGKKSFCKKHKIKPLPIKELDD